MCVGNRHFLASTPLKVINALTGTEHVHRLVAQVSGGIVTPLQRIESVLMNDLSMVVSQAKKRRGGVREKVTGRQYKPLLVYTAVSDS